MSYIAHIRSSDGQVQSVEEHLLGVKELAEFYGQKLGLQHLCGLAGMLHDLGKYTEEFRNYILEAIKNPDAPPKRGSVDHSTAGGKLLFELLHSRQNQPFHCIVAEVVGNAIISHHAYLQDFLSPELESNYLNRMKKELPEFELTKKEFYRNVISEIEFQNYAECAVAELTEFLKKTTPDDFEERMHFLSKFVFSAVIDADRTNTRLFEENKSIESTIDVSKLFNTYYERLMNKISSFNSKDSEITAINRLRAKMSEQCDNFAGNPSGIYTLSIPTGGGKTLSSLRYALKHSDLYHKKRIIYVVPYTTIIEQNAEEVRKIINDDTYLLEHHSNVIVDEDDNDEGQDGLMSKQQRLKLFKDNWDSPIIFTTMVQFLNVFFAKGNRNTRRLHNLCESVIIFDEVQKVPIPCVSLFNHALNFLKKNGRSSILLCTATQPALDFVENKLEIESDAEIIHNLEEVIEGFKRVEIKDLATNGAINNEKLASLIEEKMNEVQSVLVILNTKAVVRNLYNLLKEKITDIPIYHLSTSMCAAHRNQILEEVRQHLKEGNQIVCISTQLIEAGVDVSFECVVRSLAGLDSLAQAAGRCNRHGEKELQSVYVIDHSEENLKHLKEIKIGKQESKKILLDLKNNKFSHGGNILSKQAMDRYFIGFYTELETDLQYFIPKLKKNMTELLFSSKRNNSYHEAYLRMNNKALPLCVANSYKTAADNFNVIENVTTSVLVPFKEGEEVIADLSSKGSIEDLTKLLRKAQQYSVNLYRYEVDVLIKNGGLVSYLDGKVLALKDASYSDEYGVDIGNDTSFDELIF